jgi:hypothetical protein
MRALRFDNPADFAARVTPFLMSNEPLHNFFLGQLARLPTIADVVMCAAADESGRIVGVATQTPPWQMGISPMPAAAAAAIAQMQGDTAAADAFAARWASLHREVKLRIDTEGGIYRLDRVIPPARPAPGMLRLATLDDLDLLVRWHDGFILDCRLNRHDDDLALLRAAIEEQRRFLWCDREPASMCGIAGPTPNGIRIQAVYTPPEQRGRGYASTCVAAVSQRMLDGGKTVCFLYTDMANPTSNKIYQEIGYRHVGNTRYYVFDGVASAASSSSSSSS